jgi:hypothetical protein
MTGIEVEVPDVVIIGDELDEVASEVAIVDTDLIATWCSDDDNKRRNGGKALV